MLYALRNQELHFFTVIVSFWGKWLPNNNIQYNYKQDVDSLRASLCAFHFVLSCDVSFCFKITYLCSTSYMNMGAGVRHIC
jgi:hypothetical protein